MSEPFAPITIRPAEDGRAFEVVQYAGTAEEVTTGSLNFDEMLGQVVALTTRATTPRAYPMHTPDEWKERARRAFEGFAERNREAEKTILLPLDVDVARSFDDALADVLCWLRGWHAAAPKASRRYGSTGIERVRDFRILLRSTLANHERKTNVRDE